MKKFIGLPLLVVACALSVACMQAPQPAQAGQSTPVPAGTVEAAKSGVEDATSQLTGPPAALTGTAASGSGGDCSPLLDVLAACATHEPCSEDMTMFLPAASRDQLIAAERLPGFSEDAFDRYCLRTCQARSPTVDDAIFAKEVCAVEAEPAASGPAASGSALPVAFVLSAGLKVGMDGVAVVEIERALGRPEQDAVTPFECDSAFAEGDIRQWRYPGLVLETDGSRAVVRSMRLQSGHRLLLSSGESIGQVDEEGFRRRFGERAERVGDVYRVGAGNGSDWEAAYDFRFESGVLVSVDYWIGC